MKKVRHILITLMILSGVVFSQSIELTPFGVSPRDVARDTVQQYFDVASTGLLNVGVESKIFLKAVFVDSTFVTPTWNLLSVPSGSAAAFGGTQDEDASTQFNNFTPDLVGTYVVEMSDGVMADTLTFNAGTYTGIADGGFGGQGCGMCHSGETTAWEGTGHSDIFNRAMDGTLSTHYGPYCIGCHTTGNDPNADNDGFDDRDWVYPSGPDSLNAGTWNLLLTNSPNAMKLANIQCESCHGPASGHFGNTMDSKMVASVEVDACAVCHDSGTHHAFPEQWDYSGHDATDFDGRGFHGGHSIGAWVPRGASGSCAPCHSGSGYIAWNKQGRPSNDDGLPASISDVPEPTLITCAACHDPHDATNIHQLRLADTQLGDGTPVTVSEYGTGAQCMECHRSRRNAVEYAVHTSASSHYGPHHGPQADMLIGANAPDFGVELSTSPHAQNENTCVSCHMAGELEINGEINLVGGHSFNMNDVNGVDHVESCEPCHGNVGSTFKEKKYYRNGNADHDGNGVAEGIQLEVHGLMEKLALLLPPVGENSVSMSDTSYSDDIFRAGYAYIWVEEDRSFGIHNPAFTVTMLQAAILSVGGTLDINYEEGIPTEYVLSQNYPNPFNPTTQIKFSIAENSMTRLAIYDALGREVAVLVNGELNTGNYNYTWDAAGMASGIYFYRLESGSFVQSHKMLLIK